MDEVIAANLKGYRNDGPVRVGNAAATQIQHDTFGSIILAAMPMFFDRRLPRQGDEGLFRLLETLGVKSAAAAFTPDAGIWEYRGRTRSTPTPFRCVGQAVAAWPRSHRIWVWKTAPPTGQKLPARSRTLCSSKPGAKSGGPSRQHLAWTISTLVFCSSLNRPFWNRAILGSSDRRGGRARTAARQTCDALCRARTTLGCRNWRFSSAGSG